MSETLVPYTATPSTVSTPLWGEPEDVIRSATEVAKRLRSIVEEQKLAVRIGPKNYVMAEGWTTMCAMLGVFPRLDWSRPVDGLDGAWEARVTFVHFGTGREIASGEAMCSRDEKRWVEAERHAIRSMAQTRATVKAARLGFSWIVALAGYEATPLEEMPEQNERHESSKASPPRTSPPKSAPPSEAPAEKGGLTRGETAFMAVAKRIAEATTEKDAFAVRLSSSEEAAMSAEQIQQLRGMVRTRAAALKGASA